MATREKNIAVMLEVFRAIERRDQRRMFDLVHSDAEFLWPPSLPYAEARNPKPGGPGWGATWIPPQPGEADRAQMFYCDAAAVLAFLDRPKPQAASASP